MRIDELRERLVEEARVEPVTSDPVAVVVHRAKRSRRRRRARYTVAASLLVAVGALGLAAVPRATKHANVQVVAPPERLVVVALGTQAVPGQEGEWTSTLFYVDADSGRTTTKSIRQNNFGDYPVQLLRIGDRLLLPGGEGVQSAPFDLSSAPADIAPALVFVRSVRPDRFWAITKYQVGNTPPYEVTEFDASGHATTPELALPPLAGWPIGGTNEGLLVEAGTQDQVWLVDPVTGAIDRRINEAPRFQGDGWAAPDAFAWVTPCGGAVLTCGTLRVLDLRTGNDRTVGAPSNSDSFEPNGALSPDAKTLAVFARTVSGDRELALVDLATGNMTIVPGADPVADATAPLPTVAWSPDGKTVFFSTHDATAINRFRVGEQTGQQIASGLPPFTAIVTGTVDG